MPSRVSLSFQISAALDKPHRVILHLPGFALPADSSSSDTRVGLNGTSAGLFEAYGLWSPSNQYLQLFSSKRVLSSETLSLEFLLELPESGLQQNDARLRMALSSSRNDDLQALEWAIILRSPAVGSFYSATSPTTIQFRQAGSSIVEAGQPLGVIVRLYRHMRLFKGDTITLTLPGFGGADGELPMSTDAISQKFTAKWDAERFRMTFTYSGDTPLGAAQAMVLDTAPHVLADLHGLPEDSANVLIEAVIAEGNIMAAPAKRVMAVDPLVAFSEASFSQSFCDFRGFRWHCARRPPRSGAFGASLDLKVLNHPVVLL
jgi:hypothetical protein